MSTWGIALVLLGTLALAGSTAACLSGSYAQPALRGGMAMRNDWQNQINIELRTLQQEEAGEQMSIEYQLLRAAWRLEEPAVSDQPQQVNHLLSRQTWKLLSTPHATLQGSR
jgi:hypothetical protein